jgi:DNA gyrase subunit A
LNVLALGSGETITAAVGVPKALFDRGEAYLTMATLEGRVKRVALSEFGAVRPSGMMAMPLENGDQLGWVRLTTGKNEMILVTAGGQALRFSEMAVRPMGRQAAGVAGIRLAKGDRVASMEVVEPNGYLVIATQGGYGKRTALSEYPVKGRATGGVATINQKALDKIGLIAAARVVVEGDDLMLITSSGVVLRSRVKDIGQSGRSARGDRLIKLDKGDQVASLARVSNAELESLEGEAAKTDGAKDGSENGKA